MDIFGQSINELFCAASEADGHGTKEALRCLEVSVIYILTCIRVYIINSYTCVYTRMYVHIYMCMFLYMYILMYKF